MIPQPSSVMEWPGEFVFTARTRIVAPPSLSGLALELRGYLKSATHAPLQFARAARNGDVTLSLDPKLKRLGPEGYSLQIDATGVRIGAFAPAGIFYALQTLRQLLSGAGARPAVPAVAIEDTPRFTWRGAHLDVVRHFMPKETVLRFIDLMALHKLNTLHWHLTDNQGWRIEIRKYPLLTGLGGKTDYTTFNPGQPGQPAGGARGGYYTQDEIRQVVRHAAARHITVVPEIEMPGHSAAAIAAYPALGNKGQITAAGGDTSFLVREGAEYNVEEPTFRFLEDVLAEAMRLFPGKFVHVGGDEVNYRAWQANPSVQARIRDLGLTGERALQGWMTGRIARFIASRGRRMVGWEEILAPGAAPEAVMMSWHGMDPGIAAARSGRDVVMAPMDFTYLDTYQWIVPRAEPYTKDGFVPLEAVYAFEPVPAQLSTTEARHILGAQGQVWSEYVSDARQLDYVAWPRLCALAEVLWSPREPRNFAGFVARLRPHLDRLRALGVHFRPLSLVPAPATRWKAGDAVAEVTEHEWAVAPVASGRYQVAFVKTGGVGRTLIAWVELRENGNVVQRDTHPGTTDFRYHANDYSVELPAFNPRSKYTIRAGLSGLGGTDSSGDIYFFPATAAGQARNLPK